MSEDRPALVTLSLPLPWSELDFVDPFQAGSTCLVEGPAAWAWQGEAPALPVARCDVATGFPLPGWDTDHVVLLVPDLNAATEAMQEVGVSPRLRMNVSGRATAFFRVGPILEVIESPVRSAALYGIALTAEASLEAIALKWRGSGFEVTDPKPAIQQGRRLVTVKGLGAGLAVMSPDAAVKDER